MPPTVIATGDKIDEITSVVQGYYDCDNVFNFYRQVWGGEHLHVGLHSKLEGEHAKLEGLERIKKASSLSTEELLSRCFPSGTNGNGAPPSAECTMVDLGCGYGGTARVAAKKLGCKVVCINVSKRENETNVAMNKDAGLQDKVIVPGEKSFFETGLPDASCDVVASQDALLHSGPERHRSMAEAARVLKPGGRMVFSDIMQFKETDPKDLQDVYNRCHLEDMSTPEEYIKWGKVHGLEFVEFVDMAENLATHYGSVRDVLESRRGNLEGVEDDFMDNMVRGIEAWISAAQRNLICWGYLTFTKPEEASSDDNPTDAISATAEGWYNSDNAFNFYFKVWGGEHIHVGLYSKLNAEEAKLPVLDRIKKASILNAEELLARCFPASANGTDGTNGNGAPPTSESTMVDMGSGYGGSARLAAKTLGCKVYCINVTSRENDVNRALSKAAGIEDLVIIPGEKSYFDTGLPDARCEVVTSQDALLHAGSERHRAVGEAARLLKPGGRMVFNDVMQTNHADPKDLQEVYERVRLQDLGTPKSYAKWAESYGLTFVEFSDRTPDMKTHYESVKEVLMSHRGTSDGMEDAFIDNMARGLDAWVSAAERGLICWGYVTFAKPEKASSDDNPTDAISATAEGWYNSDNAFNFYFKVWGGDHIHVGLYSKLNAEEAKLPVLDRIKKASILNAEELLARCFPASANGTNGRNGNGAPPISESTMVDMGSGYGGSARLAAKTLGCKVYCINVTSRENDVNRALSKAAGIEDLVIIPGEKSYFDTGLPDACCEVVTSQDALLHAGSERHRAVGEAARLLKPGGRMVFNDVMQTNHADPKDLQEVYERVRLQDLGTPKSYAKWAESYGLTFVEFSDRTPDMKTHYESVKEVLMSHRGTSDGMEDEFIDNMARGLDAWVSAAERGLICWGYVTFAKPEKASSDDNPTDAISATAEGWYNSDNAFNFYFKVWGGEHIHVGLYSKLNAEEAKLPVLDRIKKASILNAEELLARCFPASANGTNGSNGNGAPPTSESTMVDMGSGYGGSARLAAKTLGCKVYCINVTSRENDVNRALSKAAGIEDLVIIPGEKSYFDTGLPDACCEVVTSQDALLHAGSERHRAVGEAARLLKPGGRMVFNDVMQTNHADPKDLQEVYERVRLQDLGTPKSYAKWAESYGLTFVEFSDRTPDMKTHYESVKEVLMSHRGTSDGMEDEFIDNMARGLDAWVSAAERDLICWGYVTFAKLDEQAAEH